MLRMTAIEVSLNNQEDLVNYSNQHFSNDV
jgi:hypothetical protein